MGSVRLRSGHHCSGEGKTVCCTLKICPQIFCPQICLPSLLSSPICLIVSDGHTSMMSPRSGALTCRAGEWRRARPLDFRRSGLFICKLGVLIPLEGFECKIPGQAWPMGDAYQYSLDRRRVCWGPVWVQHLPDRPRV